MSKSGIVDLIVWVENKKPTVPPCSVVGQLCSTRHGYSRPVYPYPGSGLEDNILAAVQRSPGHQVRMRCRITEEDDKQYFWLLEIVSSEAVPAKLDSTVRIVRKPTGRQTVAPVTKPQVVPAHSADLVRLKQELEVSRQENNKLRAYVSALEQQVRDAKTTLLVLCDAQNVSRTLYLMGRRCYYQRLFQWLVRQLPWTYALKMFVFTSNKETQQQFAKATVWESFQVVTCKPYRAARGEIVTNVDDTMLILSQRYVEHLKPQVICLVSGDDDFAPFVRAQKSKHHRQIVLAAFDGHVGQELIQLADYRFNLGQHVEEISVSLSRNGDQGNGAGRNGR